MTFVENLNNLKIKIFADGADLDTMIKLNSFKYIKGFTTNPTLMRKSGVKNYKEFALSITDKIKEKPISFEVFADDIDDMYHQAKEISSWGDNINVKIPITNTKKLNTIDEIV